MASKKDKVADKDRYSIIQKDLTVCKLCGSRDRVALHEVFFGTANRKKSKEDGLVLALCGPHHNLSSAGVHFNHQLDETLKKEAEKYWIKNYCDESASSASKIKDFINRYHINYLDESDIS